MLFVGDDWAQDHHDVYLMDEAGAQLLARRLPEGLVGVGQLHDLVAAHADDPGEVVVGIEKDHGLWVGALVAAGYQGGKEPWDAFWGQRYAQVFDPDGNSVDLFAPLADA